MKRLLADAPRATKKAKLAEGAPVLAPGSTAQFYSKSKDVDDLGSGGADWRKRLSNFWPCEVAVEGAAYPSVEHAFHALKAKHCSDRPEMAAWFEVGGKLGRAAPKDAKTAGGKGAYKKYKAVLDIEAWAARRDEVTIAAVRARAASDPAYRAILRATRALRLQLLHFERQGEKSYWGGALGPDGAVKGRNRLGEILMAVREELHEDGADGPPQVGASCAE
eukprot:TRINITY_DN5417_c0_g2_i1.p2 TRINITY_DN5417_c0_g2~~TRINITY_DN5417_c0_g2_i1.p2  ORF type:complete len:221 (+),score=58.11 TRINITY_DN5417_c0_g2_i1:1975-2637(+)